MPQQSTAVADMKELDYRLPRTVIPQRYEIALAPDLNTCKFDGQVKITINVTEPVSEVILNALDLDIHSAIITNQKEASAAGNIITAQCSLMPEAERLKLTLPTLLSKGIWTLVIKFSGTLNNKLHGFYLSTYKNAAGIEKPIASTQFEATHARRAFPCFDEPDFKAVYQSTLTIDEKLTAISNTNIASEKNLSNGKKEVVFKDTMKMSTYLVAFIVGEFVVSPTVMIDKTPLRVWSTPDKKHLTDFALKIGKHSLQFFQDYYKIPYPGDKLDMVAIPDFASGAMENLGCITYRESALLVDENASSHAEQERVADVVAHEIAHMWFGDLTTMRWWNGIWLNEAFATFAEMLAVDTFKPEWKRWNTFGVFRAAAFTTDGLKSTRPIEFPVRHAHECEAMFDVLTYQKGASVLRMLEQYLGQEIFREGISYYLNKHQFANTETNDLWDAIEHTSKQPVRKMMDSWIFQKGYPVVSAQLMDNGKKLRLSQERFFYMPGHKEKQLFDVPLMIDVCTNKKHESKKVLLTEESIVLDLPQAPDYVIVNAGGHGFYRVRYSPELLSTLSANIFEKLSIIERFNLVNDTWASVISGHTALSDYLKMLLAFDAETDNNVWSIIISTLHYLERVLDESERKDLASYTNKLLSPCLKKLGWVPANDEDSLTKLLRSTIIATLGTLGACLDTQKKCLELYEKYKQNPASVDPNLVPALVSVLADCGDKARYEEFISSWKNAKTPQEEERYLHALPGFKDKDLLNDTLNRATNGDIRTQNAPYVLRSALMHVACRKLAWEHIKKNWDYIIAKYPSNSISRMLEGVTGLVCPEMEKDVIQFLEKHPIKQGGKIIEQHLERLRVAVIFKENQKNKGAISVI